jgi:hypothetical protein
MIDEYNSIPTRTVLTDVADAVAAAIFVIPIGNYV